MLDGNGFLKDEPLLPEDEILSLLTAEQERELGRRVRAGDQRAADLLVRHNLRLAIRVAKGFFKTGVDREDIVQEAYAALILAARNFDERRGNRFSTYAVPCMRNNVSRALYPMERIVAAPEYINVLAAKIYPIIQRFRERHGREPELPELCQMLPKEKSARVERAFRYLKKMTVSLETAIKSPRQHFRGGDESSLYEFIEDERVEAPEVAAAEHEEREISSDELAKALRALSPIERRALVQWHGLVGRRGRSKLKDIAAPYDMTREGIRQVILRAEAKLVRRIKFNRLKKKFSRDAVNSRPSRG